VTQFSMCTGTLDDHGTNPTDHRCGNRQGREQEEMSVTRNDYVLTAAREFVRSVRESERPKPENAGLTESSACTGLYERAARFCEAVGDRDIVGIWQLLDELSDKFGDRLLASPDIYKVLDPGTPSTPSASLFGVRGSVTEFVIQPLYLSPFGTKRSGSRPLPTFGGEYMLYDREDRMSRPTFLREYDIEASTEKRARAEGLPWPPYVVMGGRVYYSRRLVARWFEQQAGVHLTQAVEASDPDQFGQAEQEANAKAEVDD
jgi:hypothetical protein